MRKSTKLLANFFNATKEFSAEYIKLAGITEAELSQIKPALISRSDRPKTVLMLADKGLSTRQIAEITGWSKSVVADDLRVQNRTETVQDRRANGASANGKTTRELLAQSDQNDWRTPRKYLDAARIVLGKIDLDPASSKEANATVRAAKFYTEEDNGLEKPWNGTVWLNPPYGGEARLFVERLLREYQVGNVTAALLLVNSHPTETKWFQDLFNYSICFIRGRIDFGGPSREVSSTSTHGSAIAYLGDDIDKFKEAFSEFGSVVRKL